MSRVSTPRRAVGVLSDALVVLAAILLPLALVGSWLSVVTDTDRYVATVAPLAEDTEVKATVEKALTRLAMDSLDVTGHGQALATTIGNALGVSTPSTTGAGASALKSAVRTVVSRATVSVVESPAFATAWRTANRVAHTQVIAALRGDQSSLVDDQGHVTLPLTTLLDSVLDSVQASLPAGLQALRPTTEVTTTISLVDADQLRDLRAGYRVLNAARRWLPVATGVAAALAVLLSLIVAGRPGHTGRVRRLCRTIGIGGTVGFVTVTLLAVLLAWLRDRLADSAAARYRDLTLIVWRQLSADLWQTILVAALICLAVAGIGAVASLRGRRQKA